MNSYDKYHELDVTYTSVGKMEQRKLLEDMMKEDEEAGLYEEDSIVKSVVDQFKQRSEVGIKKYGVTLDRNDLSLLEWLEHAKQESMDQVLYLEKAIQMIRLDQKFETLRGKGLDKKLKEW